MGIDRFFTSTSTIATPSGSTAVDAEGVPTTATASVTVACHVQPYAAKAGEDVLGQELAQRARRVWWPSGTVVTARSIVTIDGEVFEVHGDPKPWSVGSPGDHVEALLVRVQR